MPRKYFLHCMALQHLMLGILTIFSADWKTETVGFDVQSMFTSIPIKDCFRIVKRHVLMSAVCEHSVDKFSDYISFDKPEILAKENRYIPRMIHEAVEIQKHPNFNRKNRWWKVSTTWDLLKPYQSGRAHSARNQVSTRGNNKSKKVS